MPVWRAWPARMKNAGAAEGGRRWSGLGFCASPTLQPFDDQQRAEVRCGLGSEKVEQLLVKAPSTLTTDCSLC
jgi:hypothetical protein